MASDLARQKAAQAWSFPETSHIEMDVILAEAFAKILDEIWSQPWLGNATTRQLFKELETRMEVGHMHPDYYTTMPEDEYVAIYGRERRISNGNSEKIEG